jgi:polysaccharide biosynthesis transport protein
MENNPQLTLPTQSASLNRIHETSAKFQRYKILLRRRWWFLLLTASIGVCFNALRITGKPQEYVSLAKLVAGGRMSAGNGSAIAYVEHLQDFYGTIIESIESHGLRREALERIRATHPDLKESDVDIHVTQNKGSAIFNVTAVGSEPKFTKEFLNSILDSFMSFREKNRELQRNKAMTALAEDVLRRETQVKLALDQLTNFKKTVDVMVLTTRNNQAGQTLTSLHGEKQQLEMQLQDIEQSLKDVDTSLQQKERKASTAATTPAQALATGAAATTAPNAAATGDGAQPLAYNADTGLGFTSSERSYLDAKRSITMKKIERERLLRTLRSQHPSIIELDDEITKSESELKIYQDEIQDELKGLKASYERQLLVRLAKIEEYTAKAAADGEKLNEYEHLRAVHEKEEVAWKEMFELVRRTKVTEEMQSDYVMIQDRATAAVENLQEWVGPIVMGMVVGLGAGSMILLLFDRLDDRMNSFSEFQGLFPNEAILGQIPEQRQRGDVALLRSNDDRHLYAEAFRNVRSSLLFKNWRGKPPKTILVTSAVPNEGKTTVTSNMAITMALAGARVLLADCDLRRGGVAELFKLPVSPGLTEVLKGKTHWRDAVQETATRGLDLLARGEVFDQTSEMLLSQTADEMLREMSEEYDYIIFDSAPVLVADDTGSFAPKIDTVLFVIRMSSTMARLSGKALDLLYDRQVKIGGVILNRSSSSLKEYTYYNYASYYYTPKVNPTVES